ncbi:hypothetical protein OG871_17385 [Kitasatospora sp. NBC_00374]|uniref:serpin family protein n=1 Tax=Kitasatospora sp. NBC_00374 TaxID=2975964 RepID=UPI0030E2C368
MDTAETTTRAVNSLTARWAGELDGRTSTVLTAVGVWPLLAFLAAGADRPVRAELAEALGLPAEGAAERARALLDTVRGLPGASAAIGLWTRKDLHLDEGWLAELGPGAHARLTGDPAVDRARLNAWADHRTGGLIRTMPVQPDPTLRLVLASALIVRTEWLHPFGPTRIRPAAGPWGGRELAALHVDSPALYDRLAVADTAAGPVTEVRLPGTGDIDVHLLTGTADAPLAAVLAAGLDLLDGRTPRSPARAATRPDGGRWPALTVREEESARPGNRLALTTVPFTVDAEHDLLARAGLFGLATASGPGGFPGIAPAEPLFVSQAGQSATATFGRLGFEAAAVTAMTMSRRSVGQRPPGGRITVAEVLLDRPFAFLAVHRPSGLALAAGWVTEPSDDAGGRR